MNANASKVFYRPIEASIRWAGLLRYEQEILATVATPRHLPQSSAYPRWRQLRLYTECIYDGIVNGELPYGKCGITSNDTALLDSPELTVRHVNLKRWMRAHYPAHKPAFLFARSERCAHPYITMETGHALLVERSAMRSTLKQARNDLRELRAEYDALVQKSEAPAAQSQLSDRAETTYLNIIGALVLLMLDHTPSGAPYSSFKSQSAIVDALIAHHGSALGISERTLNGKFARAKRHLRNASN